MIQGRARSTRGWGPVPLQEALDQAMAPDGGLYLPEPWPCLPAPPPELGPEMADTAGWAAPLLAPGVLPPVEMTALAREALDFPVPLRPLGPGLHLLELFHGPTLAFKDAGARFLARVWSRTGKGRRRTVLVATSGDTGGAVARACHGLEGIRVAVLFPTGRVSEVQRRQFTTLGGNVTAVAVEGDFDRCQALVKSLLGDPAAVERHGLASANSINLGRLLPQVFFGLHLARLRGWGRSPVGRGTVVVPSGNLGNLTAQLLARRAGAPLGSLVAACNRNDVLPRFLRDGDTRAVPVRPTLSSAMDVGAPSNLERLTALCPGSGELARELSAVTVSEDETRRTIRWAWGTLGIHLDPHTAVGVAAARRVGPGGGEVAVLATAHPAKFPEAVEEACGVRPSPHPALDRLMTLPEAWVPLRGGPGELRGILEGAAYHA